MLTIWAYSTNSPLHANSSPSDAIANSKTAFLVQSGLNGQLEAIAKGLNREVNSHIDRLGVKTPVLILGAGYKVYRDKAIQFRLLNKDFTIKPDSAEIKIHF